SLGNQHAIEADIIDDDAVRQVIDGESYDIIEPVPFDLKPGWHRLTGSDGDLKRRIRDAEFHEIGLPFGIRFERNKELRFFSYFYRADGIHIFTHIVILYLGVSGDFDGRGV